jgi:hypothetical protein
MKSGKDPPKKPVSVKRLELLTNGLKGRCSTIELHARDGTFYHAAPLASTDLVIKFPVAGVAMDRNEKELEFVQIREFLRPLGINLLYNSHTIFNILTCILFEEWEASMKRGLRNISL